MARKQHGHAGHFIGAPECLFRLHTSVDGRYRISTVGEWHPDRPPYTGERRLQRPPTTIGPGFDKGRLYETMVFELKADGEPDWDKPLLDVERYTTAADAEAGHEALVRIYEVLSSGFHVSPG